MGKPGGRATVRYARVPLDTERLRTLRLRKGWSQHALSVKVGVQGAAAISAWERGVATPRPSTLSRVAEVLGVEPSELLSVDHADGLALRELRVSRGMSLKELAEAANASSSAVRRWESGDFRKMPARDVVGALARALDVPVARVETALVLARRMAKGA
ncbi:MAG: helix-turn-helix domain-containing protein [Ornithinimicrobium sp.]|uniref:helix-turn-helix domain-containing protein n=1 Tax=Ornithinimicrobium sp. TaxID=1977084 RepID=UPI003D9B8ECA